MKGKKKKREKKKKPTLQKRILRKNGLHQEGDRRRHSNKEGKKTVYPDAQKNEPGGSGKKGEDNVPSPT